jgi:hypothetical protein
MTTFLLDIWHDLREKRLWPVAAGLLAALVAIPVVLAKPAETPQVDAPPPSAATAALPVVTRDQSIVDGSHLDAFDIKDPFNSEADSTTGSVPGQGGTGTTLPGVGGGDSGAGGLADTGSGGGIAGGSGAGAPSGGSGGSGGDGNRYYTYTVDVKFGGRKPKTFKSMQTLDLLPDDQNPVVSFMGMSDGAKTAVFFVVDPAFEADGEGSCNPSPEDCRFIYLGLEEDRDEETLSAAEGAVEYTLQLTKINIRHLSASEAVGDATPEASPDTPAAAKRSQRRKTLMTVPLVAARR